MFLKPSKIPGIVLGPQDPDNPKGNWLYLTTGMRIRRIHADELKFCGKEAMAIKQRRGFDKYVAFDKETGRVLIVLNCGKVMAKCIVCSDYKYFITPVALSEIEKAPMAFVYRMGPKHSVPNVFLQWCKFKKLEFAKAKQLLEDAGVKVDPEFVCLSEMPDSMMLTLFTLVP